MNFIDSYSGLNSPERDRFAKICRKLLAVTFIVKDKDEQSRSDFFFVRSAPRLEMFNEYFQFIGYCVKVDETAGVVMLANSGSGSIKSNRVQFRLYESVVLCSLWLLYEAKMTSDGLRAIMVTKAELDMEIERLGYADRIDRNAMQAALKKLSSFNLIDVIGEITEPDCAVRLYPSLRFCMEAGEFKAFVEQAVPKMKAGKNKPETEEDTENEE